MSYTTSYIVTSLVAIVAALFEIAYGGGGDFGPTLLGTSTLILLIAVFVALLRRAWS